MTARPIIKILSPTRVTLSGSGAEFITAAADANLPNERVATSTPTVAWDFATAGQAKASVPSGAIGTSQLADASVTNAKISATSTKTMFIAAAGAAKLGGSGAGWVIDADNALPFVTLPASQTSEVLLIPISTGLMVGDTVTSVGVCGQIESAGNTVTMTLDVRKVTAAAADFTDVSLGTDNLGAGVTAQTILSVANLGVVGLAEVLAADEFLYVTIMATTGVLTDIVIAGIVLTFTRPLP